MPKNFVITSLGRSGTKFLHHQMNKSKQWTVKHEGSQDRFKLSLSDAQARLSQDFYGEVNGRLRFFLPDLVVEKKGIILRHPYEVLVSSCNRTTPFLTVGLFERRCSYQILDQQIEAGVPIIWFDRMTTDVDYLHSILLDFGVTDVGKEQLDLEKQNETPDVKKKFKTISDLSVEDVERFNEFCGWFLEKYFS